MAGLDDIAKAFVAAQSGADELIAAENPYLRFKAVPDRLQDLTLQAAGTGKFKTKDLIASALISGLGSGIADSFAQDYTGRAQDAALGAITAGLNGASMERPDVLSPGLFKKLNNQGQLFRLQTQMGQIQRAQDRQDKLADTVTTEIAKNPYEADAIRKALGMPVTEPVIQETGAGAVDEIKMPNLVIRDPEKFRAEAEKYRKEINAQNDITSAASTGRLYKTLQDMMDNPAAVADIPFFINLMKAGDPTSTVTQTETGMVISSQSLPNAVLTKLNQAINGEGNAKTRGDILSVIEDYYKNHRENAVKRLDKYAKTAARRGIPRDEIDFWSDSLPEVTPFQTAPQSATAPIAQQYSVQDLQAAGYSESDIAALRQQGVVK